MGVCCTVHTVFLNVWNDLKVCLRACVYYGNYVIMCAEICAYMCYSHKHTISWITHINVHVILLHMYSVKDLKESDQMELIDSVSAKHIFLID